MAAESAFVLNSILNQPPQKGKSTPVSSALSELGVNMSSLETPTPESLAQLDGNGESTVPPTEVGEESVSVQEEGGTQSDQQAALKLAAETTEQQVHTTRVNRYELFRQQLAKTGKEIEDKRREVYVAGDSDEDAEKENGRGGTTGTGSKSATPAGTPSSSQPTGITQQIASTPRGRFPGKAKRSDEKIDPYLLQLDDDETASESHRTPRPMGKFGVPRTPVSLAPPLKRAAVDKGGPNSKSRRPRGSESKRKRVVVREDGERSDEEDEEAVKNRSQDALIDKYMKDRLFNGLRLQMDNVKSLLAQAYASKSTERQLEVDTVMNSRIVHAESLLEAVNSSTSARPGNAARKKYDADAKKSIMAAVKSRINAMDSVGETTMAVHVEDVVWDQDEPNPDPARVRSIKAGILGGTCPILTMNVKGYQDQSTENGRTVIFIHSGAEIVEAYKELGAALESYHPGVYKTLDESKIYPLGDGAVSSTQPLDTHTRPVDRGFASQQEIARGEKLDNPFAWIFASVVNKNTVEIPIEEVSFYKAMRIGETEEIMNGKIASQQMKSLRRCAKTFKIDLKNITQADLNETLKMLRGYNNAQLTRALKLDDIMFKLLVDTMEASPRLNSCIFAQTFMNARKISPHTADMVLKASLDRQKDADEVIKDLREHSTRVYYVLTGAHVPEAEAVKVETHLEPGQDTIKKLKLLVNDGKKLRKEKLIQINYKAVGILKILARELNPCFAFSKPIVSHRPKNDGVGEERCIVAFISYTDLKNNTGVFKYPSDEKHLLFVTHANDDKEGVIQLLNTDYPKIGYRELDVDSTKYKDIDGTEKDNVKCLVLGWNEAGEFSTENLNSLMGAGCIHTRLVNWQLRKLVYDAIRTSDPVAHRNEENAVYLHTANAAIRAIVANLAPYRVIASENGPGLTGLSAHLDEEQLKRADGFTFARQHKTKTGVADDSE